MAIIIKKARHKTNTPTQKPDVVAEQIVDVTAEPKTLADVVELLKCNPNIEPSKRSDLVSACNGTAKMAALPLNEVRADAPTLRGVFAATPYGTAKLSRKRWANIRSAVIAACNETGVILPMPAKGTLLPEWEEFFTYCARPHHRFNMSRFATFCVERDIKPSNVNDGHLADFAAMLDERLISSDPREELKDARSAFNKTASHMGIDAHLSAPPSQTYRSAPLSAYPVSLQDEINAYLKSLGVTDEFADIGSGRALRPVSIRNTRQHLLQVLDAAVASGIPRDDLVSLSTVVKKSTWAPAYEQIRIRIGQKYPQSLTLITRSLLVLARTYLDAPQHVIDELTLAKKKISSGNGLDHFQMGQRPRAILAQFDEETNIDKLIRLPVKLLKQAPTRRRGCETTLDAMVAAAIAILMNVPLRMRNLCGLHIGKELIRTPCKSGKCSYAIQIPASDTKNKLAIDAVVSGKSAAVLDQYISKFRPSSSSAESGALFPDAKGKPRQPDKFGSLISQRIEKHTGLQMTPHVFRHLCAKLILDANPENTRTVQKILHHKQITTTTNFYCDPNAESAFKAYHDLLEKKWSDK